MADRFNEGIQLFNAARYFDAHEAWEDEWRESKDPERRWLQGLTQAAVALHHRSTGNVVGAISVMARSIVNLNTSPGHLRGVDIRQLRQDLELALAELRSGNAEVRVTVHFV